MSGNRDILPDVKLMKEALTDSPIITHVGPTYKIPDLQNSLQAYTVL